MTMEVEDLRHLNVNDYVEVEYTNDKTEEQVVERGVVDELMLDDEYPCIEMERGGSRGLRLSWGPDGDGPFAVTTLSFQEKHIGTGERVARLHGAKDD